MAGFMKFSGFKSIQRILSDYFIVGYGGGKNFRISFQDFYSQLELSGSTGGGTPIFFEGNNMPSVNNEGQPLKKGDWALLEPGETYTNIGGGSNLTTPLGRWTIGRFNGSTWSVIDMGELPKVEAVDNTVTDNIDKSLAAPVGKFLDKKIIKAYPNELLRDSSLLNSTMDVSGNKVGEWSGFAGANLSIDSGALKIELAALWYSGIRHQTLFHNTDLGTYFDIEFEGRSLNGPITLGIYVNSGTVLKTFVFEDDWKKFSARILRIAETESDGRTTIGTINNAHGGKAVLMKNISIKTVESKSSSKILKKINALNYESRLNKNTYINPSTYEMGMWSVRGGATASKEGDSIRISRTATVPSGILNTTILPNIKSGERIKVILSARLISGSPNWGFFVSSNWNDNENPSVLTMKLTPQWNRFEVLLEKSTAITNSLAIQQRYQSDTSSVAEFKDIEVIILKEDIVEIKDVVQKNARLLNDYIATDEELVTIVGDSISTSSDNNAYELEVLSIDVGQTIKYHPTWSDVSDGLTIGGVPVTNSMIGVLTSFTPSVEDIGKKLGKALIYNGVQNSMTYDKLWWGITIEKLGWKLCQNNSWSGSTIYSGRNTNIQLKEAHAWSDRTINTIKKRDSNGNWIIPTKIIIYRGTNDFSYWPYARIDGQFNINNGYPESDIRIDGTYGFKEAYALTIKKYRESYPYSEIILCTLNNFKRANSEKYPIHNTQNSLVDFNKAIRELSVEFGCRLIEFDKSGITYENMYPRFISDSSTEPTHPNEIGHYYMAKRAIKDLIK